MSTRNGDCLHQPQGVATECGDESIIDAGADGHIVDAGFASQALLGRRGHQHATKLGSGDEVDRGMGRYRRPPRMMLA
mgnify:CR=1 FL=1